MNRWNDRENHVLSEYAISFSERLISKTLYGIKQKLASLWITQNPLGIYIDSNLVAAAAEKKAQQQEAKQQKQQANAKQANLAISFI